MTNRHYVPAKILETALAALSLDSAQPKYTENRCPSSWLRIDLKTGICTLKSPIFFAEMYCSLLQIDTDWTDSAYYLSAEDIDLCINDENVRNRRSLGEIDRCDDFKYHAFQSDFTWIKGVIKRDMMDMMEYLEEHGEPMPAPSDANINIEAVKALQAFIYSYKGKANLENTYSCTLNSALEDSILLKPYDTKSHDFATLKLKY